MYRGSLYEARTHTCAPIYTCSMLTRRRIDRQRSTSVGWRGVARSPRYAVHVPSQRTVQPHPPYHTGYRCFLRARLPALPMSLGKCKSIDCRAPRRCCVIIHWWIRHAPQLIARHLGANAVPVEDWGLYIKPAPLKLRRLLLLTAKLIHSLFLPQNRFLALILPNLNRSG